MGGAPDVSLMGKLQNFFKRTQGDPFYAVVAHRNFKPVEGKIDIIHSK